MCWPTMSACTTTFELVKHDHERRAAAAPRSPACRCKALYYALLEWSRAAELTADRASALGTGDPLLTCRTLMRMAGGPVPGLNLDAFITPGDRVRGGGRPVRALLAFLVGDRHDPSLPRAPRPGARRLGGLGRVRPPALGRVPAARPGAAAVGRVRRGVQALPGTFRQDRRACRRRRAAGREPLRAPGWTPRRPETATDDSEATTGFEG